MTETDGANQEPGSYHVQRPHHILAFDVRDGSHLGLAACSRSPLPGSPTESQWTGAGRVYASSFSGVQVFTQAGDLIGQISLGHAFT